MYNQNGQLIRFVRKWIGIGLRVYGNISTAVFVFIFRYEQSNESFTGQLLHPMQRSVRILSWRSASNSPAFEYFWGPLQHSQGWPTAFCSVRFWQLNTRPRSTLSVISQSSGAMEQSITLSQRLRFIVGWLLNECNVNVYTVLCTTRVALKLLHLESDVVSKL